MSASVVGRGASEYEYFAAGGGAGLGDGLGAGSGGWLRSRLVVVCAKKVQRSIRLSNGAIAERYVLYDRVRRRSVLIPHGEQNARA